MNKANTMYKHYWLLVLNLILLLDIINKSESKTVFLYSDFSWDGINGNLTVSWGGYGTPVTVSVSAEPLVKSGRSAEFDWSIHPHPVSYSEDGRCEGYKLGPKKWDLSAMFGKIKIPMDGPLEFETTELSVVGNNSIWGHSFRIKGPKTVCANLMGVGGENTYEARHFYPFGGSIWFRSWDWDLDNLLGFPEESTLPDDHVNLPRKGIQSHVMTRIYNTKDDKPTISNNIWMLYITDVLDTREYVGTCDFLDRVYDASGKEECDAEGCPRGNLTHYFGNLKVDKPSSRKIQNSYNTNHPLVPDLSGSRRLYVGIHDLIHTEAVIGCAQVRQIKPREAQAIFSSEGVDGKILFEQPSPFSPTEMTLDLTGLNKMAGSFRIHQLPTGPPRHPGERHCVKSLGHYNPFGIGELTTPHSGFGSHDQYEVGDLSGKHGMLTDFEQGHATVTDHNLPVFGAHSIIGRSIVIYNVNDDRWVCANIRQTAKVVRAAVVFRYPLVGEIIFEQEEGDSLADTTVIVGPLVYSDGSHNDTNDHEWHIHSDIPGKDYYDWQNRCTSAGERYNPHRVSLSERGYPNCKIMNSERCSVSDLFQRHGPLKVAGSIHTSDVTKHLFTDRHLPLSGPYSIMGRSVVIQDLHAPKHRGNRLSCSGIHRRFRHKGVVNEWFSTRGSGTLEGKVEFIQETEYDITNTEVKLQGLEGLARGYHVHVAPVLFEKEFPCIGKITYGHYNPLNVTPSLSPPPDTGSDDLYELGDMSGKYGTLEGKSEVHRFHNDTLLPLWGPTSVMGRSVVVHKKEDNQRWFCGNIAWGYSRAEARQVAAIASFHHPTGFAWGYIRMRQLVYNDGGLGETYIEVNLRHPGKYDKNVTRGHNWSLYVNPVGFDAGVKFFQSRCVAGGFRWNPYLIHLAFPNNKEYYDKQCTPEFPLRCDVGDLSGRHGPIDLGDKRYVFVDQNLPLAGNHSALRKSIIIHNENGKVERFACANIEEDHDIVKWTNLKKPPKFSASVFMDEVRDILNTPEWFLAADLQTLSYSSDGKCVKFRIRFMGPYARKIEQDFTHLLSRGKIDKPSIVPHGIHLDPKRKTSLSYKTCSSVLLQEQAEDLNNNNNNGGSYLWNYISGTSSSTSSFNDSSSSLSYMFILVISINAIFRIF